MIGTIRVREPATWVRDGSWVPQDGAVISGGELSHTSGPGQGGDLFLDGCYLGTVLRVVFEDMVQTSNWAMPELVSTEISYEMKEQQMDARRRDLFGQVVTEQLLVWPANEPVPNEEEMLSFDEIAQGRIEAAVRASGTHQWIPDVGDQPGTDIQADERAGWAFITGVLAGALIVVVSRRR